ncbi:hypothetical protein HK103_005519 [Boothiomyces macroporosus]|uniref:Uncharacterized protein n=1 Tax=Boothiomyces macroporosus TaxID=261099 RepID=A0AAD5UF47_9FUNG|nr:hypothetical protein HK103_005519 [Boothiomyces macroporosus]
MNFNEPIPTFWESVKARQNLKLASERISKHLKDDAYEFPFKFQEDVAKTVKEAFSALSNPETASDENTLGQHMTRGIASQFVTGYHNFKQKNQSVEFKISKPINVVVTGAHLYYGPFPAPEGYVAQNWLGFLTLIIPGEHSNFENHTRQKELLKSASDEGVYFRIDTIVETDIEIIVTDDSTGLPVLRDRRTRFGVTFTSPHFTPWDEIFDLQPDYSWKLKWDWKMSDVDGVLKKIQNK